MFFKCKDRWPTSVLRCRSKPALAIDPVSRIDTWSSSGRLRSLLWSDRMCAYHLDRTQCCIYTCTSALKCSHVCGCTRSHSFDCECIFSLRVFMQYPHPQSRCQDFTQYVRLRRAFCWHLDAALSCIISNGESPQCV